MMNNGSCLCGAVTWQLTAEPQQIFNCHCRMCQKTHGTAYGTYWFVRPDELRWTSGVDTIVHYRSSDVLVRSSCGTCGSVVPYPGESGVEHCVIPGGCHDHGRKPDCDIFVADNAPWHDLTNDLPRHDAYPEESGLPSVDGPPKSEGPEGVVRGSCLCGEVIYHVTQPFKVARNCHCSRCRRARSAAHASNCFTSIDGVHFVKGEEHLKSYKVPDAKFFTQVFCDVCCSPMPRLDAARGIAVVPMGSLDDDPGVKPIDNIFVGSKADWHDITDDLPAFDQGPPS